MKHALPLLFALLAAGTGLRAATSIHATNRYAHGANIGWIDLRGDGANGVDLGLFYCTGFAWSANCGWIHFGSGTPGNGHQYANNSSTDWGINHIGGGFLRGLAYGANIGWLQFETNGNPRVDLQTGAWSGFAYGANVGWISLSNLAAFARTERLSWGPDTDGDGIPDAWEHQSAGSLTNLTMQGDADEDGVPDAAEYLADTDPLDPDILLEVTSIARNGGTNRVTWTVEPTRFYRLNQSLAVSNGTIWADSGLGILPPGSASVLTGVVGDASAAARFYRAEAVVPLPP